MKYNCLIRVVLLVGVLFVTSCEDKYNAGYQAGYHNAGGDYQRGYEAGRGVGIAEVQPQIKEAYDKGYAAGYTTGFEAARPGTGREPTGVWLYLTLGAAILGMAKIVISLVAFTLLLIFRSQNAYEIAAKAMVTSLSALFLFWLYNSLTIGFATTLDEIFLSAGAGSFLSKLAWGLVGGGGMYGFLWLLESLVKQTKGRRNLQAICIFISSFVAAVLTMFFFSLLRVPNLHAYLFFDLIFGVAIGGVIFIVRTVIRMGDHEAGETVASNPGSPR